MPGSYALWCLQNVSSHIAWVWISVLAKWMCAVKAFCPLAYLTKQTEAEKSKPHTFTSTFPTMRLHNSTFQGQGHWPHHLQKSVVLPKGGKFGRQIFEPYEVPLHAPMACTGKTPLLWHSSCPSALAEHVHNKHVTWPTFLLEPALPTLWEVTLPPYNKELHPTSDYSYGEFLPKSGISTWKEFLGNQNTHIKSSLSI